MLKQWVFKESKFCILNIFEFGKTELIWEFANHFFNLFIGNYLTFNGLFNSFFNFFDKNQMFDEFIKREGVW